jgi:hypothetical protein
MAGTLIKTFMLLFLGLIFLSLIYSVKSPLILMDLGSESVYKVKKSALEFVIDGNWEKPEWQGTEALQIDNQMGEEAHFFPKTNVKLLYDDQYLYGIFKVEDRYVQCMVEDINGPVYTDSCVEFFFSPDEKNPFYYFNLEINCIGAALMQFSKEPPYKYNFLSASDIEQIEIAHSFPKKAFSEIENEVTWTIEFKIPFRILEGYSYISSPKSGVIWKANFYKTASKTSNPHYITWSYIDRQKPDFHLPQYFGSLIFQ